MPGAGWQHCTAIKAESTFNPAAPFDPTNARFVPWDSNSLSLTKSYYQAAQAFCTRDDTAPSTPSQIVPAGQIVTDWYGFQYTGVSIMQMVIDALAPTDLNSLQPPSFTIWNNESIEPKEYNGACLESFQFTGSTGNPIKVTMGWLAMTESACASPPTKPATQAHYDPAMFGGVSFSLNGTPREIEEITFVYNTGAKHDFKNKANLFPSGIFYKERRTISLNIRFRKESNEFDLIRRSASVSNYTSASLAVKAPHMGSGLLNYSVTTFDFFLATVAGIENQYSLTELDSQTMLLSIRKKPAADPFVTITHSTAS